MARALDIVGERWTMLVVRELLLGPKRFTDLEAGLPGVPSTLLGSRLRGLQESGLVTRRRLPSPAASLVYELTPKGRSLETAVYALARWGAKHGRERRTDDAVRPEWAAIALRSAIRPELAARLTKTCEIRIAGGDVSVVFDGGAMHVEHGPVEGADAVIAVDHETLMALATGRSSVREAVAGGALRIDGEVSAAIALIDVIRGSADPQPVAPTP